ncbi:MAG: YggS family pyridoxal phosphate-dependent enzyme [Bacteroidales bacterium]|jgi:pyridoxal phosphate enzyme (YggS family)|nr:YggS family pyridoxal phosphate-dependent enzyme [Bacteroidales bacterium]
MGDIVSNIRSLRELIPPSVKLVAVSKTRTTGEILEAWEAGQKVFGENRVQELLQKKARLPDDIEWHLIGHLQSNKVRQVVPNVSMIESADSFRLIKLIDREAAFIGISVSCLLQIHIAEEVTKYGFTMDEVHEMLASSEWKEIKSVRIAGVMGMATFTDDTAQVRSEFRRLKKCFDEIKEDYFRSDDGFREISMGMSGDYSVAVEEGSTIVRIGSLIFGERIKKL